MNRKIVTFLQYMLFLFLGLFLVWWQLHSMSANDKTSFYNSLKNANYWLIVPVTICSILSHLTRSMRWKLLMEPLGYKPGLKNVFACTMAGYLANTALPRFGEVLKCTLLGRYEQMNVSKLIGTIIVERVFDFICFFLLIVLTVAMQLEAVGDFAASQLNQLQTGGHLFQKILMLVAGLILIILFTRYLFRKYPSVSIIQKLKLFISGLQDGMRSIRKLRKRSAFFGYTILMWGLYLFQIYIGFMAMPETSALGWPAAISVLTLASLAMIVTPGGIGSFPIFVMQTLLLFNVSGPVGNAFGWLIWGTSTGIILITGLLSLAALPVMNKNTTQPEINNLT